MNQKIVILVIFLLVNSFVNAQYGVIDPDFNPEDLGNYSSSGCGGRIFDVEKQSDGKILAAGQFTRFNNLPMIGICRLDENGKLDSTFQSLVENTFVPQSSINRVIELSNGQILIGGLFNIGSCVHLARLNADGSLDPIFNNDTIFNGEILNMEVLQDGRILVSGRFSECYGQVRNGVAILNPDGSLDSSFLPATDPGSVVRAICLTQDSKILIGKTGGSIGVIQKLLLTGEIDSTFSVFNYLNSDVIYSLKELSNGKILASGQISIYPYNADGINGIVRLNSDGSWDTDFHSYSPYTDGQTRIINDFLVLNNGSIIIGGRGDNYYQLSRLDSLGNEDYSFEYQTYPTGNNSNIHTLFQISDSSFLIGGYFIMDENEYRNGLMKFTTEGKLVPEFMPYYGANKGIKCIAKLQNDQLMIAGDFNIYNGHIARKLARINSDGSLDTSFHSPPHLYLETESFAVQSTGKVILKYGSILRRYDADGSLDSNFNVTVSNTNAQFKVVVDNSDNIYYSSVNAMNKLNPDGSVDVSFDTSVNISGNIDFIVLQSGKLLIIGGVNQPAPMVIRLNPDGTLDNTFALDPLLVFPNGVYWSQLGFKVFEDSNGKLLISGHSFQYQMSGYTNTPENCLFRLNSDGSFDSGFKSKAPVILTLGFLSDGTIITLSRLMSDLYPKVRWIKNNGDIDYRFIPKETVYANYGLCSAVLSDDRCVMGGYYMDHFGSDYRNNILAIENCFGPVKYDHITAYDQYTWEDGVNYTQSTIGQQYSFNIPNACDSLLILDLNIIHPEINVFTTPAYNSNCDGVAYVTMTGIGPFTFSFQSSDLTTANSNQMYTGLCPGIYDVTITDGLGLVYNSTFVIAQDSNYYFDDPFSPGTVISDSISIIVENCDVDYNTVYDIYIDSYVMIGQDSVLVSWAVIDSFNTTIIDALYYFPDTSGNYYIQLELFCPEKSTPHFLVATQGVNYHSGVLSTLGMLEEDRINLSIYPNPTNNQVRISFSGSDAELTIYDLQGKVVLKDQIQNQGTVSLEHFERGVYLFDFRNSQGQSVQRVVKH